MAEGFTPRYETWRHGGWYVTNVRYPSGACGCVSNNYSDHKWRIVAENTGPGVAEDCTFPSRDAAARAEYIRANAQRDAVKRLALDVVYAVNLKPGDRLAGYYVPDAPTRPVQPMAAALKLTSVEPFADDDGKKRVALTSGQFALFSADARAQALVIRGA